MPRAPLAASNNQQPQTTQMQPQNQNRHKAARKIRKNQSAQNQQQNANQHAAQNDAPIRLGTCPPAKSGRFSRRSTATASKPGPPAARATKSRAPSSNSSRVSRSRRTANSRNRPLPIWAWIHLNSLSRNSSAAPAQTRQASMSSRSLRAERTVAGGSALSMQSQATEPCCSAYETRERSRP